MDLPLMLDLAIKGSLLVALAAAGALLGRRSTAAHRHFLWALALGGLVALPLLSSLLPWRLPVVPMVRLAAPAPAATADVAPPAMAAAIAETAARAEAAAAAVIPPAPAVEPPRPLTALEATVPAARGWMSLASALRLLWIAGIAFVVARLVAGVLALRWIMRDARDVSDRGWLELLASASERLDMRQAVRLVESPRNRMPMTFGVRRPVVVLPMGSETWSPELRETVLLHELAHVRRGDVRANLLGQLACALYWFHPLVWRAARRLRLEAERACDDLVLQAGAPASAYAGHLLQMVQASAFGRAPALAVPMAQPSAFEGRVLAILDPRLARHGLTRRGAALGIIALLAITLPLAALSPAQTVTEPGRQRHRERNRNESAFDRERQAKLAEEIAREVSREASRSSSDMAVQLTQAASRQSMLVAERAAQQAARVDFELLERRGRSFRLMDGGHAGEAVQSNPAVTGGLIVALQDSLADVRIVAARALGARGDTAAINALLVALRRDSSREVRKMAAWALGEIEDERAVTGLSAALQSEDDREVRVTIVWALGEIESATAVDDLGAALRRETDPEIRRTIVWALGEIESPDAVPFLATVIRDSDVELREKVAWALGEIESPAAIEPLTAMLSAERVPQVREMIVWALGEIEDPRAVPALESALRDTSLGVRRKAVWALGEIDGLRTAPAGLIAAVQDSDTDVRRAAVHALGEIQDPATVQTLIAALRDTDLDVRRGAVHALGEIPGSAAVEALVAALRDPDPEIRRLAARALGDR